MTSTRVRSVVDDCLTTNESDSMVGALCFELALFTKSQNTPDGGQNKKRKSGSRVTVGYRFIDFFLQLIDLLKLLAVKVISKEAESGGC